MYDSIFETMINVCFKSGDILREHFKSRNYTIIQKTTPFDLVTNADEELQECIISNLSPCYPDIAIISEERVKIKKYDKVFYVNPLDGTLDFVHKFPFFSVFYGVGKIENLYLV